MKSLSVLVLIAISMQAFGAESKIIFEESDSKILIRQCSRPDPLNVTGFWKPSAKEALEFEKKIDSCLQHPDLKPISKYARQFAGIIKGKKRFIYLNARFVDRPDPGFPIGDPKALCDGGTSIFGVVYDPRTGELSEFHFNGPHDAAKPKEPKFLCTSKIQNKVK